jgi:tetratricopeptide (TPR) repeat protein
VTLYNRAIAVTTNNFIAHYDLAEVLSSTKPDEALAEFQKSVDIYPDYALAQLSLAWALNNHGRASEAIVHLEQAIQLEPQNELAQDGLGELLFQLNRVSEAIPHLLKAIEIDSQVPRYKDVLGQDMSSSEHGNEVVSSILATARLDPTGFDRFLEAMQFDTNRVDLINNLAWAFATNPDPKLRNGKYAIRLATRSCEMTGFQTTIIVGTLAAAYAEAGRFDEAVLTGQKACALASEHGASDLLKRNQELLVLYQAHKAYHESIEGSSP